MTIYEQTVQSAEYIKSRTTLRPETALILGSGLGAFAEEMEERTVIPYGEIPGFLTSTAPGHNGCLVIGKSQGKPVLCMQGRFHLFEGYALRDIVFPVRVMKQFGIRKLLVTNSSGGINLNFTPGDLMIIEDHINLLGTNPLIGPNEEEIGVRFPDMSTAYDPDIRSLIAQCAERLGISIKSGIYCGYTGPSYETPAEIRMMRTLGADATGMSTVPEVIAANHCGIRVAGISCITNMAAGILPQPLTSEEVIETADRVKNTFIALLREVIKEI